MIADWSRLLRIALVLSLGLFAVARPLYGHVSVAWADGDDDEDEGDDDDDDGDDEGDDEEEDEDQPPVTAGGLFDKENYPQSEILRPLTITKGMTELRAGIDMDVSAKSAFKTFGIGVDGRHGLEDNFEIQAGVRSDLNNFSKFNAYGAVEFGIVYDLVDFRAGIAIPYTKTAPVAPATESTSSTGFNLELGFPFRYSVKPQFAIIALDTFMTFNFTGGKYTVTDMDGTMTELNSKTPDLTPSVGIIVQPVPVLAVKVNAKMIIQDFNTDAGNFQIPVSINVQFSPKNLIDIGGEFTFPNLKPPEPAKFYDSRFLLLYGQLRI
jgi:hypothetical protein